MRLRDRLVGLGLLFGVLGLAACANGQPAAPADEPSRSAAGPSAGKSSTSFLTYGNSASAAELAALKRRAGIEPCPRTDGPAGTTAAGLPALTLPCLGGGRPVDLAGLRGTPTVLNVWAQWCGPCREEIPLFEQLHERSAGRLRVLGIDLEDPNTAAALEFAEEIGMSYPQLQDLDGAVTDALHIRGIPLTIFVTAEGRMAASHRGVVAGADELDALVEQHLGVAAR